MGRQQQDLLVRELSRQDNTLVYSVTADMNFNKHANLNLIKDALDADQRFKRVVQDVTTSKQNQFEVSLDRGAFSYTRYHEIGWVATMALAWSGFEYRSVTYEHFPDDRV